MSRNQSVLKGNNKQARITRSATRDKGVFDYWVKIYYYSDLNGGFWYRKKSDKTIHATSYNKAMTIAKNQLN